MPGVWLEIEEIFVVDWNVKFTAAEKELEEAQMQWKLAEQSLAIANARLDRAQREHARVFKELSRW